MTRARKSVAEIQNIVWNRVHGIREVIADRTQIRIPAPQWHEPDAEGRNWDMAIFGNAAGYESAIGRIVEQARDEFELDSPDR